MAPRSRIIIRKEWLQPKRKRNTAGMPHFKSTATFEY